jgi:hypothetical protein
MNPFVVSVVFRCVLLENDHDDHDPVGVLSTVCGYMSDDGFTIVQRKYRTKRQQDTIEGKRSRTESNGHQAKCLSKRKETAKAIEGNEHKRGRKHSVMMSTAHYI